MFGLFLFCKPLPLRLRKAQVIGSQLRSADQFVRSGLFQCGTGHAPGALKAQMRRRKHDVLGALICVIIAQFRPVSNNKLRRLKTFPLFGQVIHSDNEFASLFLKYGKVAVVPGSGFGAPNFIRWSYAASMDNIKAGLDRLEMFLQGKAV